MSPRAAPRKLNLADVMILVAMTGVSLSCYLLIDNGLFRGQRYFFGLFERPTGGWGSAEVVDHTAGALAILLTMFGGWTLALPLLRLRQPRPGWRKLSRQPGMTASLAAIIGMLLCLVVGGSFLVLHGWLDGTTGLAPGFWIRMPLFDNLLAASGLSVAAVWITQIVTGLWRPSADWLDRLGRGLGSLWIASGLVASIRLLMP